MTKQHYLFAGLLALATVSGAGHAVAGKKLPVVLVSSSPSFDRACVNYYRQGNDRDVMPEVAREFCTCLGAEFEHLGTDALDFFGRTYSEDLTTFIHEYPEGDNWMEYMFAADKVCKESDYGPNEPAEEANPPPGPIKAASWGGAVRSGPGQEFSKVGTLAEGEEIMLVENTSIMHDGYPWWRITVPGSPGDGYQWGGIICSLDGPMEGVYETCE